MVDLPRPLSQIIGINPDAMPTDQTGGEIQEIPFCPGGFQNVIDGDAKLLKNHGNFIDKGDVNIPLGIFDNLGGLCGANAGGGKCPATGHSAVDMGQHIRYGWCLPGNNLGYLVNGMFPVPRINSFR